MERAELEKPVSLKQANSIVHRYCDRNGEFADEEIHRKGGIVKTVAEEYLPLLDLAKKYFWVRSIRLMPYSNDGPDGEIRYWWRLPSFVQITCSNESYDRALMREQLANGDVVFTHQTRCRVGRAIEGKGRAFTSPPEDLSQRCKRILDAIQTKNGKFYARTDTLLVLDDPANFQHLRDLHDDVRHSLNEMKQLKYKKVFIAYGSEIKRAV